MITFPPSPALSDCDSLAGIDDLDAFLEAQGQLSHFPTPPPLKDDVAVEEIEIDVEDGQSGFEYRHIAAAMSQKASMVIGASSQDVYLVEGIMIRAELPPELLGIAYNILSRVASVELPLDWDYSAPVDLMAASALFLAVSYTHDRPPSMSRWSRYMCDYRWAIKRIDETVLRIMAALDWRLHDLSSPHRIHDAMAEFARSAKMSSPPLGTNDLGRELDLQPKLCVDVSTARWVHGQLTPEGTPPSSAFGSFEGPFLQLL